MPLSYAQTSGNGTNRNFDVPCEYLSKSHVAVRVDGVLVPFTWIDTYRLMTSTAPAAGTVVEVRRTTPRDERLVTFTDGSTLVETDLNTSTLQSFFLAQEAFDQGAASMGVTEDGQFTALNRRITNLADPVNNQDAVTKGWVTATVNTDVAIAVAAKNDAVAAREVTITNRTQSQTARTGAETALASTVAARDLTLGYRNDAASSSAGASSQRGLAQAARDAAEGFKTTAETARDAAVAARNTAVGAQDAVATNAGLAITARNESVAARDRSITAETTAVGAKTAAETAAGNAASDRGAAQTAKTASEAARDVTLTARNVTTAARDEAVSAQTGVSAARDLAVLAAEDAEDARDKAVAARDAAAAYLPVRVDGSTGQVAFRNKLMNGSMRVSQRGQSGSLQGYTLDRWALRAVSGTNGYSWSRQVMSDPAGGSITEGGPLADGLAYFLRWNKTGTGTAVLSQRIEDVWSIPGQTQHTLSFWAKASVATTLQLTLTQHFGTGTGVSAAQNANGPIFNLSTGWQKFRLTFAIPTIAGKVFGDSSYFDLKLQLVGAAMLDITGIQFEQGSSMTPFELLPFDFERHLCRRFYFGATLTGEYGFTVICQDTGTSVGYFNFPVKMRISPSLSNVYSSFDAPFSSAPSSFSIFSQNGNQDGFRCLFSQSGGSVQRGNIMIVSSGIVRADAEL